MLHIHRIYPLNIQIFSKHSQSTPDKQRRTEQIHELFTAQTSISCSCCDTLSTNMEILGPYHESRVPKKKLTKIDTFGQRFSEQPNRYKMPEISLGASSF